MSKFVKNLVKDSKGIKEQRAVILANEAKNAQEDLTRRLIREMDILKVKMLNLEDMSPENDYSLRPGGKGFNAATWVAEVQATKVAILNKEVELKLALATTEEWFAEETEKKAKA